MRYHKDGTVVVTDNWTRKGHISIPKEFKPNAVLDTVSAKGSQRDRTIYDADGIMKIQIHSGNHGQPKQHPYGAHGEHAHDYVWHPGISKPVRTDRDVSDEERIQNADILGDENDVR